MAVVGYVNNLPECHNSYFCLYFKFILVRTAVVVNVTAGARTENG
jgi:hypothetical protein